MDISRETSELIKIFLLLYALGLVVAWRWFGEKLRRGLLIALVVVSTANYARFGPKVPIERVDTYDLIHYYLNTKYFDELGYYDLYPAAILVDLENGGPRYGSPSRYMAQNEAGHGYMPIDHAVSEGKRVRSTRFTAERWEAFEHDFLVLHRDMPGLNKTLWAELILDHGFNGTPPWTTLAEGRGAGARLGLWLPHGDVGLGLLHAQLQRPLAHPHLGPAPLRLRRRLDDGDGGHQEGPPLVGGNPGRLVGLDAALSGPLDGLPGHQGVDRPGP